VQVPRADPFGAVCNCVGSRDQVPWSDATAREIARDKEDLAGELSPRDEPPMSAAVLVRKSAAELETIYTSEAVLIANQASLADPGKRKNIDRLTVRLKAALAAHSYKYIMLNAPPAPTSTTSSASSPA